MRKPLCMKLFYRAILGTRINDVNSDCCISVTRGFPGPECVLYTFMAHFMYERIINDFNISSNLMFVELSS